MNALLQFERAASAWSGWALERGIDGLLALLVALVILGAARGASPHFRSALLVLALVPLVAPMPWLASDRGPLASVRGAIVARLERVSWLAADGAAHLPGGAVRAATAGTDPALANPPPRRIPLSWRSLAFAAWLAAVLGLLARWILRERRLRRALHDGRPLAPAELPDFAGRPPLVIESDPIEVPASVGWLRPAIVLPASLARALSAPELRFVLLHETAHVRRRDAWLGAFERLVRIVWFFHPSPWVVGRLLAAEREAACDDAALSRFRPSERRACAAAFLKVVELAGAARSRLAPVAALPSPLDGGALLSRGGLALRSRIVRILETRRRISRRLTRPAWLGLAASSTALVLLLQPARGLVVSASGAPAARPRQDRESRAGQAAAAADRELIERVRLAADWLLRHQDPSGFWDADEFSTRCKGERCTGSGKAPNDIGVTGLALLALVEARKLERQPRLGGAIERSSSYLEGLQDPADGCIGPKAGQHFMYGHAFATLALAELQTAAPSSGRATALRRAVGFLARARNPYQGWRYAFPPDGDNDASVTSTVEIALGRALDAGVPVEAIAIDDGFKLLDAFSDPASARTGYHERGSLSAREPDDQDLWPAEQVEAVTAVALHARVAHDMKIGVQPAALRGVALLAAKLPKWDERSGSIDFGYWHHGTAALRAVGGEAWRTWRRALLAALPPHQRDDGDATGSFDPQPDPWGDIGGRVYSTALNLLTLAAAARP